MVKIAFWIDSTLELLHVKAVLDYAYYNLSYLKNDSLVIYDEQNPFKQEVLNRKISSYCYPVMEFRECDNILRVGSVDILYILKKGNNDGKLTKYSKSVIHCLSDCTQPHGAIYSVVTPNLPKYIGQYPVVPLIDKGSNPQGVMDRFKKIFIDKSLKIVDTFSFFNEMDMLEFRLMELNDVVDYFVLVESNYTHSGHPKPYYYLDNKERYAKYNHKIIHYMVEDMPNAPNPWVNEGHQRDKIADAVKQLNLCDSDLVVLSDCDEIPNTNTLRECRNTGVYCPANLSQDLYYYNLTTFVSLWTRAKLINYGLFKLQRPTEIRISSPWETLYNAGWHFSYFGDPQFIIKKIENFAHQELNNETYKNTQKIQEAIENRKDIYSSINLHYIPIFKNTFIPIHSEWLLKHFKDDSWHIDDDGNRISAYYGANGTYHRVTTAVLDHFLKDHVIQLPMGVEFNTYFGDPAHGVVKQLTIHINDEEYTIPENATEHTSINIKK